MNNTSSSANLILSCSFFCTQLEQVFNLLAQQQNVIEQLSKTKTVLQHEQLNLENDELQLQVNNRKVSMPQRSIELRQLADSLQEIDSQRKRLLTQRSETNDAFSAYKDALCGTVKDALCETICMDIKRHVDECSELQKAAGLNYEEHANTPREAKGDGEGDEVTSLTHNLEYHLQNVQSHELFLQEKTEAEGFTSPEQLRGVKLKHRSPNVLN